VNPAEELAYIEQIRKEYYGPLADMPVPVSEENFKVYGSSTSPTLVLIDAKGIVRMYNPGAMSYDALEDKVKAVLAARLKLSW